MNPNFPPTEQNTAGDAEILNAIQKGILERQQELASATDAVRARVAAVEPDTHIDVPDLMESVSEETGIGRTTVLHGIIITFKETGRLRTID